MENYPCAVETEALGGQETKPQFSPLPAVVCWADQSNTWEQALTCTSLACGG